MNKTKFEKGITLVALIITIVVLLIIAVVTIGAVQESGIIGHAQKAESDYKTKADEENTILAGYLATIEDNIPGAANGGDDENIEEIPDYSEYELGDRVYYNSNPAEDNEPEEWIVYTKDDNGIEIISVKGMGELVLGYNDPYLPNIVPDYDGDGVTEDDNGDKALWSYNNAIETINKYCNDIVTATDNSGVRSVGATLKEDKSGMISQSDFETLLPNRAGEKSDIRAGDTYYSTDYEKMKNLNGEDITYTDASLYWYWFASRDILIRESSASIASVLRFDGSFGTTADSEIWKSDEENLTPPHYRVRPIITNPINISLITE